MIYFERVTPTRWAARAHIQTPCDPLHAAAEFSWDHPHFQGLLEVTVQGVEAGRPTLTAYLVQVDHQGCCHMVCPTDGLCEREAMA